MAGIIDLYYKNKDELKKQKKRIAPLQLTSKLQDYLIKEFANLVIAGSSGHDYVLTNYGCKGEPKISMCLVKGELEKPVIFGMIEAKYIRNIHRMRENDNATDEVAGTLDELYKKLGRYPKDHHCNLQVNLNSKENRIYGLVFASHVTYMDKEGSDSKKFFNSILEKSKSRFAFYDLKYNNPRFDTVYEREEVQVLNRTAYVTLKTGLWTKREEL